MGKLLLDALEAQKVEGQMSKLFLDSLEIQNFRCFRHLQIEKLGRVNLIVGKNNVGKTALLEALQLYASHGLPQQIWQQLIARREYVPPEYMPRRNRYDENEINLLKSLKNLFYGREEIRKLPVELRIGPEKAEEQTLFLSLDWYAREASESIVRWRKITNEEVTTLSDEATPRFTIRLGKSLQIDSTLRYRPELWPEKSFLSLPGLLEAIPSAFISANGLNNDNLGVLWDRVTLRDINADILNSLRIIAPGIEGYSFIGDPPNRLPIVKIAEIDEPLPLGHFGNGMQRILGIALSLVNMGNGILLIDEIENGVHYGAQQELWQVIFQLASRLNIQVFATTHSWDCIEAFQRAAAKNKQEDGILIRLALKQGEIGATLFNEEDLQVITRERVEVR